MVTIQPQIKFIFLKIKNIFPKIKGIFLKIKVIFWSMSNILLNNILDSIKEQGEGRKKMFSV